MHDEAMSVRTESLSQSPQQHMTVRVHTPVGTAVVVWRGDPQDADGRHLSGLDGSWVQISVGSESVAVYPYRT